MQGPFIAEEKVVFGIHAHALSQMTISKIRKVYNKVDSKSIAKQVMHQSLVTMDPVGYSRAKVWGHYILIFPTVQGKRRGIITRC